MRKVASSLLTLLLGAGDLLMAFTAFQRNALPYNAEGRYFDASEGMVYTDSGPVVFGGLAALLTGLTLLAGLWTIRAWRR